MISAVQNIERQFQIPSKLSGFLVSARTIFWKKNIITLLNNIYMWWEGRNLPRKNSTFPGILLNFQQIVFSFENIDSSIG